MLGAIAGDIIGSVYEHFDYKAKDFPLFSENSRFTDDSVLTVAVADAILHNKSYLEAVKAWGQAYPNAGYGGNFMQWLLSEATQPYYSFGNGAAMRVSPVGFAFPTLQEVQKEARKTAEITHNHPEGIKGAQATATAVFMAFHNHSKADIKQYIEAHYGYNLSRQLDDIRPAYQFDVTCQGSVPEAMIAFLESSDFEDCLRNAISLGGDSDTIACIAGGMAHAYYKNMPDAIQQGLLARLPENMAAIAKNFCRIYEIPF